MYGAYRRFKMPVKLITPSRAGIIISTAAVVSVFQLAMVRSPTQPPLFSCDNYRLETSLAGPISQDDPRLVEWIGGQLVPPALGAYNLDYSFSGLVEEYYSNNSYSPAQEFILEAVFDIFQNSTGGSYFFIEAGAYDGEFLSNTLSLEKESGWRGLLVEPNKKFFDKLQAKHRKAWSINACLSTNPYPSQEMFADVEATGLTDYIANPIPGSKPDPHFVYQTGSASSRLIDYHNASDPNFRLMNQNRVQCLPLYSITRAMNINHVHFFSLDVEGAQMGILHTIPWSRLTFTMLAIEHTETEEDLVSFMKQKGYALFKKQYPDYIFVNEKFVKLVKPNPFPSNKRKRYLTAKKH